jgi:hypothetical protein
VDDTLWLLIERQEAITAEAVDAIVRSGQQPEKPLDITIPEVDLAAYDAVLNAGVEAS